MDGYSDIDLLLAAVQQRLDGFMGAVIAIEGHSTSGKTFLSRVLGARLGIEAIETDSFARSDLSAPTYVERIDTAKLGAEITRVTGAGSDTIVEGICLRDTLAEAAVNPKLYIYVKRITAAGLWADDPENELDGNWTDRQSIGYHARTCPLERADLVYLRRDE